MGLVAAREIDLQWWGEQLEALRAAGRAERLDLGGSEVSPKLWFAAESLPALDLLYPAATFEGRPALPPSVGVKVADREEARRLLLRGHMEVLGPTTAGELGARTGLEERDATWGLQQLEAGGFVLRGRFTPGGPSGGADLEEWCDRRLLARVHRLTLDRLRREIDPVSAQDFMRFLLRWQHLGAGQTLAGRAGVRAVIEQLQGVEAPATEWEGALLPARVADYTAQFLDDLSLGGEVAWGRLAPRPAASEDGASAAATRATPVAVVPRARLATLLSLARGDAEMRAPLKGAAAEVHERLRERGALFFEQLVEATRRLPGDIERALRELVSAGLVSADGFQGLRQVAGQPNGKGRRRAPRRGHRAGLFGGGPYGVGPGPAGRWALLGGALAHIDVEAQAEAVAEVLLRRYGVVLRELALREPFAVPWREVLRALRRMEARGTVRGGRFVTGFMGEQYGLAEAVDALRRVRREPRDGARIEVSACDPLNLTGVLFAGPRVPSMPGRTVVYIDGAPLSSVAEPLAVAGG